MKKGIVAVLMMSFFLAVNAAGDPAIGKEKAVICVACHGVNGVSSMGDWPNLAGQGAQYIEKQLREFKSGACQDPVMSPQAMIIADEDIEHLATYFSQLPGVSAATQGAGDDPEALLALSERIYRGGIADKSVPACMACHGPSGRGIIAPSVFPALSAQQVPYTRKQLQTFHDALASEELATDADRSILTVRNNDTNMMMRDIAARLTPKQIEALAYYMQGLR